MLSNQLAMPTSCLVFTPRACKQPLLQNIICQPSRSGQVIPAARAPLKIVLTVVRAISECARRSPRPCAIGWQS